MDAQTTNTDKPTASELRDATYAALDSKAVSEDARKLVSTLCDQITATEIRLGKRQHKRVKKAAQLWAAVEGFLADLLRAQASGNGLVYRPLRPKTFTGEAVSYRTFTTLSEMLSELGLVESRSGFQDTVQFDEDGPKIGYRGYATRFRAKQALLDLSEEHGVRLEKIDQHFHLPLPKHPLQLRANSTRNGFGQKTRGKLMDFPRTRRTEVMEGTIKELNEFLNMFELRGGTHRGYLRVFNNGYDPDFDWDKGGRLYSHGHGNYQQMPKADRLQMTINGEPVCEIDIRASYLTIFHAWNGARLDPRQDPYQLPGLGPDARPVVKAWFVATFGNEAHLDKWPKEIAAEYRDRTGRRLSKDYPISRVRERALEAHPVLARWGEPIETWRMDCPQDHPALRRWRDGNRRMGWAELMYLESAALWYAMQVLKDRGIPGLSMHDSLIVPASKQDVGVNELRSGYARVAMTSPITLVVHHPRSEGDEIRSTVLYGDEDPEPQRDEFEEFACPEEADRTNPARWDEDSVGDSERTDNDHEVVREHPPYDPDKPWDF